MNIKRQMESRCLRALHRHGGAMREGSLGHYVREPLASQELASALASLEKGGLVTISPTGHGRARRVILTASGEAAAKAELLSINARAKDEMQATVQDK